MIEEISLHNKTLSQSIELSKNASAFLLDNDQAIDWGEVLSTISTFTSAVRVGVGINKVSISKGRTITITGWMINDGFGTIKEKKAILNTFCNPFDEIVLTAGEYKISGRFNQAVKYSNKNKENNEIICKFMLYLFCEQPLFTLINESESSMYEVYQKSFSFPWIWIQPEKIVFGLRQSLENFSLMNNGTISTGFKAYLYIGDNITGLTIKNNTTGEEFRLKPNITLETGEILLINTVVGSTELKIGLSMDDLENAFSAFDLTSDFFQLTPGENSISISCDQGDVKSLNAQIFVVPLFYAIEEQ